ncbi:inner membrane transport protein YbaT [bacterium BMS3Abin04]|nr:inner membrane transport protein YbaT [bacterium BMS3Abin04]
MSPKTISGKKRITLIEAISIAVGTMIGASIFTIFGVGAEIAKQDLPETFLLSAFFAFAVAYSYTKLGGKIVSNAGPIAFILKGFGDTVVTGSLSVLMWLSYVVSISLFAKGFSGYFLPLFGFSSTALSLGITEAVVIAFFTVLNFFGSKAVGKAEFYIVLIKLLILGVFIVFGFLTIKPDLIAPSFNTSHVSGLIHASVIFFLSYMGFGLITNISENMENPQKNVPKAIIVSIAIVSIVYISVALVAVGNLPLKTLIASQDNALAVAAKPFLGKFGFLLISIGALFSISSALNATLYGGANTAYSFAKEGELPEFFERKEWFGTTEGLYITAALGLLFALLFNIGGIAAITSSVFTVIYIFVLSSHLKIIKDIGGNKWLVGINLIIISIVFLLLLYYQWLDQRSVFYGTIITFAVSFAIEYIYRKIRNREFKKIEFHRKKLKPES